MASDLIKVTGLWESTDKDGNMVLSGNLSGSARILIFVNKFKEEQERGPDYEMYVAKKEPKDE